MPTTQAMQSVHSLARHYVKHRFTVLFATLIFAIGGHGLIGVMLPVANPLNWLIGVSLVAIIYSVRPGPLRWFLGGLVLLSIAWQLGRGLIGDTAPSVLSESLVIVVCLVATGVAIHRAFAPGNVDVERICAALAAYLLAGIAFGAGYWVMQAVLPGSFSTGANPVFTPTRAVYFSFVTQATLGFGDIVPISERSQGIVVVQGVGGQMYLAVLVARLVSLYSVEEEEEAQEEAEALADELT